MHNNSITEKELIRCYKACFINNRMDSLSQEGKVVLSDIMARGFMMSSPFSNDPYTTAKNCGSMELASVIRRYIMMPEQSFSESTEDDINFFDEINDINGSI